jgi:hypothetical protein
MDGLSADTSADSPEAIGIRSGHPFAQHIIQPRPCDLRSEDGGHYQGGVELRTDDAGVEGDTRQHDARASRAFVVMARLTRSNPRNPAKRAASETEKTLTMQVPAMNAKIIQKTTLADPS